MRFRSRTTGGFQVFAVSGVNTVSFAIRSDASSTRTNTSGRSNNRNDPTRGLLGFAVERIDPTENQRYFMSGFKVFRSVVSQPDENTQVSTFDHPVQSFVWDDFTAKPGREYEYLFYPVKGTPRNLDRSAPPIRLKVRTESQLQNAREDHEIFFNRGAASSQAYARRFGNLRPDDMTPAKREEALHWLGRELPGAMLHFINAAKRGDTLLCCFYEFRHKPIAQALKTALERGVQVRIVVDGKKNGTTQSESFPREENRKTVQAVGLPSSSVFWREARTNAIQHNKFMVLLRGARQTPSAVWTGSTNISQGGIYGQTNVGHWVRDQKLATQFRDYWTLLCDDLGAQDEDDAPTKRRKNDEFRQKVEALFAVPENIADISVGITPVFSPRRGTRVLDLYATLMDDAQDMACITLAFGINARFKKLLQDNTHQNHIAFFLLEKEDKPNPRSSLPFVQINAANNVYKAWGSFLREPLHQWARETSAKHLGLNQHVSFIHSKFLLHDPLGNDPIIVTGSANFSDASTTENDENMMIVRGNKRVADIYFTEFNRLFNHYYFRSLMETLRRADGTVNTDNSVFLCEDDSWLTKYKTGTFRRKRVQMFAQMQGFSR